MGLARGSLLLLALGSLQLLAVYGQDVPNNPCNAHSCDNGGTCTSTGAPFYHVNCTCPSLTTGQHCEVRLCTDPGNANRSTRVPQMNPAAPTFQPGDTISYSCNVGYRLVGSRTLTCNSSVWSAAVPQCAAVTCPYPGVPSGGSLSPAASGGALPFNSTITATCGVAFTLIGRTTRRCMANGQLNGPAPFCSAITCPALTRPSHGSLSVQYSGRAPYNATVMVTCDSGYKMTSGSSVRRCAPPGAWTGTAAVCSDFCQNTACPAGGNTTWTDCCTYAGRSVQCCQPGVQNIIKDRYRNITNGLCKNDLSTTRLFSPCIGNLFTCLSLQLGQGRPRCPDIHGCGQFRTNASQCRTLFGPDAMLCMSSVHEGDIGLATPFCLPPSCSGSLDDVAASDYIMNCDILTTLGNWDKCPLDYVKIACPGGNGTYAIAGNNPPSTTDEGLKPGYIALIIILVLLGVLLLVGVLVFIYRKGLKPSDSVDFARLQNEDDGDGDDDDA